MSLIQFDIITLFPDIFDAYFSSSIIKRAQVSGLVKINTHNIRNWAAKTNSSKKQVDDKPYGGGYGMILKPGPIYRAIKDIKNSRRILPSQRKIILLSPRAKLFNQKKATRLAKIKQIILICGRYEGFDHRILKFVDEEISVGNYILTGGEIPAMTIVDAVVRLVPRVINSKSLKQEQPILGHSDVMANKQYPQYTRPEVFTFKDKHGILKIAKVPKVLLSGNHEKIRQWRKLKI
ncbi:tRNA (guanosine(37)-N1)-methyltransferase TrmD [Patescibacteria group bacterium]|nr:tRNA (guanosine(37)-N1)-methyltransferase TrmD [Patescibacteria group bacterium]